MTSKRTCILITLLFVMHTALRGQPNALKGISPISKDTEGRWVTWSSRPALAWQDAFVTGNGKHGTMVTGSAGNEHVICVHDELFIRLWDRHKVAVANIANLLPQIRKLSDSGKFTAAATLGANEARKQLTEMGAPQAWSVSPHPAFDLNIKVENTKDISNYRRSLNMETGETKTNWEDKNGVVEESVFSSRTDNMNVIKVGTSAGRKLNVALNLSETPGRKGTIDDVDVSKIFSSITSSAELENSKGLGWLKYRAGYTYDAGGYEGLARVTIKGGQMNVNGNHLQIKNADEILIVMRITPLEFGSTSQEVPVRNELSALSKDYNQ